MIILEIWEIMDGIWKCWTISGNCWEYAERYRYNIGIIFEHIGKLLQIYWKFTGNGGKHIPSCTEDNIQI